MAGQKAVDLYRELAAQRPDAFRRGLAISLTNLATKLTHLGRREPAMAAALCRLYNVPPSIVGDQTGRATMQNAQQEARQFATFALAPWAKLLEAEFARQVLPESFEIEIDLSALTRADPDTRWQQNAIAVGNGILTVNEIRGLEDFDPVAGGDVLRLHPGAPVPTPAAAAPAMPGMSAAKPNGTGKKTNGTADNEPDADETVL